MNSTRITPEELEKGLERGHLFPHFQPQVSTETGEAVGVEALARWRAADGTVLGPESFLEVAEECGRMAAVTDRMMSLAVSALSRWRKDGLDLGVSLNITPEDLFRSDFPDLLLAMADRAGIRPERITLEVTENRAIAHGGRSLDRLARLKATGARLSLDDFGTAYSSLKQLRTLPFDELKIDRAFVSGVTDDPEAQAVLRSSIDLAHELGLDCVAEGVETEAELRLLASLGCERVQGFFIARPLQVPQLLDWHRSWEASPPLSSPPAARGKSRLLGSRLRAGAAALGLALALAATTIYVTSRRSAPQPSPVSDSTSAVAPAEDGNPRMRDVSVAVLPLVNLSRDSSVDYLSDGLAEEISSGLGELPHVNIVGRSFTSLIRDRTVDVAEVGQVVGARFILDGSFRKTDGKLHLTVRLVSSENGRERWAKTFHGKMEEVFLFREEIARAVSELARPETASHETSIPPVRRTEIGVLELYLLARAEIDLRTTSSLQRASTRLEEAIALDPTFVPALVTSAEALALLANTRNTYGRLAVDEVYPVARKRLQDALELDPHFPRAHAVFGLVEGVAGNTEAAMSHFWRALELEPDLVDAHNWLAFELERQRDWPGAIQHYRRVHELDPLSTTGLQNLGAILVTLGKPEEAESLIDRFAPYLPEHPLLARVRARVASHRGDLARAVRLLTARDNQGRQVDGRSPLLSQFLLRLRELDDADASIPSLEIPLLWAKGREERAAEKARALLEPNTHRLSARIELAKWEGLAGHFDRVVDLVGTVEPVPTTGYGTLYFGCNPLFQGLLGDGFVATLLGHAYRSAGRAEDARRVADKLGACQEPLERFGVGERPRQMLESYRAALELDVDRTLALLENLWDLGYRDAYLGRYPFFRFLEGDPRWSALLERHEAAIARQREEAHSPRAEDIEPAKKAGSPS